jgi:hypothetical protein
MATTPGATAPNSDPIPVGLQKLTALAGVGFVLLVLAVFMLSGDSTPDRDAPLAEWTTYAKDNQDGTRIAALLVALAAYEFVFFLGLLRSHLGRAEADVLGHTTGGYFILIGGTLGIAGLTGGIAGNATALSFPETNPETIRALYDMAGMAWTLASPGFAAMFIAAFVLIRATRALPAWLGWVALAAGIFQLLELGVLLDESLDNAFGAAYPFAFLTMAIFTIGTSVVFFKHAGTDTV